MGFLRPFEKHINPSRKDLRELPISGLERLGADDFRSHHQTYQRLVGTFDTQPQALDRPPGDILNHQVHRRR
jgi:hypothetical protein